MRAITITVSIILASMLAVAIASGSSHLVTTLITIPLGAVVGFSAVVAGVSRMPRRQRGRRTHRAPVQAVSNVVMLHAQRAPVRALPAPAPYRLAA